LFLGTEVGHYCVVVDGGSMEVRRLWMTR
jgi:hypothetical protein